MDLAIVDRPQLLRDIAQSMDIDPDEIIKSQERMQAEQALQNQMLGGASQGGPGVEGEAGGMVPAISAPGVPIG